MATARRKGRFAIAIVIVVAMVWVWGRSSRYLKPSGGKAKTPLVVFAAASLTEPFDEMKNLFERQHHDVRVVMNFAGSQELALQIEQGAECDVFAAADQRWMNDVEQRQLLSERPRDFVQNDLIVVLPARNPGHVQQLPDLSRKGLKIVVADEAVPVGRYTREVLNRMSRLSVFGLSFGEAVLKNVVSEEDNVKAVLGKVQLGEADAGFVYRSDVSQRVKDEVIVLEIPQAANIVATYPLAVLKNSTHLELSREFEDLVMSPAGQRILANNHFIPAVNSKERP